MAERLDRDDWQDKQVPTFSGGLTLDVRPDVVKDTELTFCENLWLDREYLRVDTGFHMFAGECCGTPMAVFQFYLRNGNSFLCLITTEGFYTKHNDEWQIVSDGTSDALSVSALEGESELTTVGLNTFQPGDRVGVFLDDGTQAQLIVENHLGHILFLSDPLPNSASAGKLVVRGIPLHGTTDIQISIAVMPAFDWMIFTNGVDVVKRFDGITVEDVPNLPSNGDTVCRSVQVFYNFLFLLNTIEGGEAHPQRVRWSNIGDPTVWVGGNANYVELFDTEDVVMTAEPLGPYLIIYKERTILRGTWVGSQDILFQYDTVISSEGAISQGAVANIGDRHHFLGNNNIYEYTGGFDITPIGDKIYYKVFGANGDMSPQHRLKAFAFYVEELDETWFFYASNPSSFPDTILRYAVGEAWFPRQLPIPITGYGFYQRDISLTWTDLTGKWLDYTYPWNSKQILSNSPTTLLCGVGVETDTILLTEDDKIFLLENGKQLQIDSSTSGQVYEYDYVTTTDNDVEIEFSMQTKDFSDPGYELRVDWLQILLVGGEVLVEWSEDQGQTFRQWGIVPASAKVRPVRLYGDAGQIVVERIRFRVSGVGGGFKIGWMKLMYKRESVW